jgi:hypothetical protein
MDEVRRGARPYEADDGDADGEEDADGQAPRTLQ